MPHRLHGVALGFAPDLAPAILTGDQRSCLRAGARCFVGARVLFYTYVPPGQMLAFRPPARVVGLQQVRLLGGRVLLDGRPLPAAELPALARAAGFDDPAALLRYLSQQTQPFEGQLIYWQDFPLSDQSGTAGPDAPVADPASLAAAGA